MHQAVLTAATTATALALTLLAGPLAGVSLVQAAPLKETLKETLVRLRTISRVPVMGGWRQHRGELTGAASPNLDDRRWQAVVPDAKGNINWPRGRQVLWLRQWVTIPDHWPGGRYPTSGTAVRLNLIWWAEAVEIYVDGRMVQAGDLYDAVQRVPLTASARPGERFLVALKLTSPGHDIGALSQSHLDVEAPTGRPDPGMVADELEVVHGYLSSAPVAERPRYQQTLNRALSRIDWEALREGRRGRFEQSLARTRQELLPFARITGKRTIALVGHSHIDMAWLWPVPETKQVVERTFRSTLGLMEGFPELNFAQSTAQSYEWLEKERPQLFETIRQRVREGRWELVGGMWVEPDLNLPDGESLVRQVLYGKRYFKERFGKDIRVGWNPDSFGYTWQLPQIYKKSGIDYFLTQKLDWNDTTRFPHKVFWWQAPDGSRILSYMATPLGKQIDALEMATTARTYEKNTGHRKLLWMYGVGDHGGGPTRDMLETARRWQTSPVYPRLVKSTALAYFEELAASETNARRYPTWNNELYLEFHRGTFTTHADQKRHNRQAEVLLGELEKFGSASEAVPGFAEKVDWAGREGQWKTVLFNQFHDILPGSAIAPVYEQANREWQAVLTGGREELSRRLGAMAAALDTRGEGVPVVVFNSLAAVRSGPVVLPLPAGLSEGPLVAVDRSGQGTGVERTPDQLHFWGKDIPGVGYKIFWLRPAPGSIPGVAEKTAQAGAPPVLENASIRAAIDSRTGELSSVVERTSGRELLYGPGNRLQFFKDEGQYWDAWNIDPKYERYPLEAPTLVSARWIEDNPVRQVFRVVRRFRRSSFEQDYVLYREAKNLQIQSRVDWQERHVLVKAAFPVAVRTDKTTYEIPFATIERSNRRDTPARKAQWEVPALRWADLSDSRGGLSLINDSKYGHDSRETTPGTMLRLSLLRGPTWPNPGADRGSHEFAYALYPHQGDWRAALTVQQGLDFNTPLHAVIQPPHPGVTPPPFLAVDHPQVVLAAWKRAEEGEGWIVRLYESQGRPVTTQLATGFAVGAAFKTDLLERRMPGPALEVLGGNRVPLRLGPYEIQTLHLRP